MTNFFVKSSKEILRYAQNDKRGKAQSDALILSLRVPIYWDEAISWRGGGLPRFARNDIKGKAQNDMEMT